MQLLILGKLGDMKAGLAWPVLISEKKLLNLKIKHF